MKRLTAILLAFVMLVAVRHVTVAENELPDIGINKASVPRIEELISEKLNDALKDSDYEIGKIEGKFISQEYIEEVAYNTKANIFFGYTLAQLDAQFEGTRYVFTLGDDDQTTVIPFEEYIDESVYMKLLKDMAVGAGVILVCVTVASMAKDAPAICVVLSIGGFDDAEALASCLEFLVNGVVAYIQTGDLSEVFDAVLLDGNGEVNWSAIVGLVFDLTELLS